MGSTAISTVNTKEVQGAIAELSANMKLDGFKRLPFKTKIGELLEWNFECRVCRRDGGEYVAPPRVKHLLYEHRDTKERYAVLLCRCCGAVTGSDRSKLIRHAKIDRTLDEEAIELDDITRMMDDPYLV